MPPRANAKSKGKARQATLASFYTSARDAQSQNARSSDEEHTLRPSSPEDSSDADDIDDPFPAPQTSSSSSSTSVVSTTQTPLPDTANRKRKRPITDIPLPVLSSKDRAILAKQAKGGDTAPSFGPLDQLMGAQQHSVPPLTLKSTPMSTNSSSSSSGRGARTSSRRTKAPSSEIVTPLDSLSFLPAPSLPAPEQPSTIIEIRDDSPEVSQKPSRSASTRAHKAPHPFFQSRSQSGPSSLTTRVTGANGANRTPVIDLTAELDSPVKPRPLPTPRVRSEPQDPSWPSELADHVNRESSDARNQKRPLPLFPPRRSRLQSSQSPDDDAQEKETWYNQLESFHDLPLTTPTISKTTLPSAPIPPTSVPNSRQPDLVTPSLSSSSDLWTVKHRPTRARDILGSNNALNAEYTKQWLQALALELDAPSNANGPPSGSVPSATPTSRPSGSQTSSSSLTQGTKRPRPRIVRAVEKEPVPNKKRRKTRHGYDDDWVVDEEDEDEDGGEIEIALDEGEEDEDTFLASLAASRGSSPIKARLSVPPPSLVLRAPTLPPDDRDRDVTGSNAPRYDFSSRLTNALLLTGPSGTGKTSSIYACAEELGWSVFEVYPGMSKRGAKQMNALLDGVGKNHTLKVGVAKTKAGNLARTGSGASVTGSGAGENALGRMFLAAASKKEKKAVPAPSSQEIIDLDADEPFEPTGSPAASQQSQTAHSNGSEAPRVNQSIILIEEVDLLFQGESGFWQAVIDVIKESRRPVIMTCTDINLVPINDLPLQDILHFVPPSTTEAVARLTHICQSEGVPVPPRPALERLYETVPFSHGQTISSSRLDHPDRPLHPVPSTTELGPDFRQALMQLQFTTSSGLSISSAEMDARDSADGDFERRIENIADSTASRNGSSDRLMPDEQKRDVQGENDEVASLVEKDVAILRNLGRFMDDVSYVNSLGMDDGDFHEAVLNDHYEVLTETELDVISKPRPDDLLGYQTLRKARFRDNCPVIPLFSGFTDLLHEAASRSRILNTSPVTSTSISMIPSPNDAFPYTATPMPPIAQSKNPFSASSLFAARAQYQTQTLSFLEELLTLSSPLFPRPSIFTEYVPCVIAMVRADDAEELFESQALAIGVSVSRPASGVLTPTAAFEHAQTGRLSRTGSRGSEMAKKLRSGGRFVRYLNALDAEQLEAVRRSALV